MGKLVGVELRKMSRCRLVWGVALFILGTSSLTAFKDTYDYAAYTRYANFEYMMYTHATARVFSALTILVTAVLMLRIPTLGRRSLSAPSFSGI